MHRPCPGADVPSHPAKRRAAPTTAAGACSCTCSGNFRKSELRRSWYGKRACVHVRGRSFINLFLKTLRMMCAHVAAHVSWFITLAHGSTNSKHRRGLNWRARGKRARGCQRPGAGCDWKASQPHLPCQAPCRSAHSSTRMKTAPLLSLAIMASSPSISFSSCSFNARCREVVFCTSRWVWRW